MLMFAIMKSDAQHLMAECIFVSNFIGEDEAMGEKGFSLATFETALEQIVAFAPLELPSPQRDSHQPQV